MRTRAKVVATAGEYATVLCDRRSACDSCHKTADGGECSVCSLMGGARSMQACAYNAACAQIGDIVEIETTSTRVLGYAALVFILPITMIIFGYMLAGLWTESEVWRFAFSALLAGASLFGIRLYSEHVHQNKTDLTVVAVIDPDEPQIRDDD